ncbi:restriction endonuclease [Streptomyces sp. NPDC052291]|uniref:restriction endonuclease n=1 Tax=Streptomyces sp. NPDC052291 TaxID=3161011 RepID=UPI0034138CA4
MGAFRTTGECLIEWLFELVGRRVGLAVSLDDLNRAVTVHGYKDWLPNPTDDSIRVRAEECEALAYSAMDHFGSVDAWRSVRPLEDRVSDRLQDSHVAREAIRYVESREKNADLLGISDSRRRSLVSGTIGTGDSTLTHAVSVVLDEINIRHSMKPWVKYQGPEWRDLLSLSELFSSESTMSSYGKFFDQRFINYLVTNHDELSLINWRKFEGLVGEYFHRCGFEVALGPGRNDDGVDLRIWESHTGTDEPPLLIVQCKREKRKISKVTVKALAADVIWEGAQQGLLVATTDWSPGARNLVQTRKYRVSEVNRAAVHSWLADMHSSGVGL